LLIAAISHFAIADTQMPLLSYFDATLRHRAIAAISFLDYAIDTPLRHYAAISLRFHAMLIAFMLLPYYCRHFDTLLMTFRHFISLPFRHCADFRY
jgi:hypothetical protein